MSTSSNRNRLEYLDWFRGLAAVIMLQGHVFDSFLRGDLRGGGAFIYSQFIGGMPPAIFLFLTGVTLAFLMHSSERKGLDSGARLKKALRRAGYLLAIATAFRIQMFLFAWPASQASDLFKVDVLNCMALTIAVLAPLALFKTVERIRHAAVLGLAIAFASPIISQLDWSAVPAPVRAYIVPDGRYFGFFPWASYLAFGVSAGSLIKTIPAESVERAMQWGVLLGGALIGACMYCSNLPFSIYPNAEYWLNSPALPLTKLGVTLIVLAFAYLWTRHNEGWSWVRQLGTTSLLVYWVHIELIYGRWLTSWKGALTVGQTVAASATLILLMLILSFARTNRDRLAGWLNELRWRMSPRPDTAGGD
jgi:uncharacterized membrane protein